MLTKKKKIFMLAGMVLLLAVTAYLNFALAANADNKNGDSLTVSNFFTEYQSEKQTARNEEISYLDSIINTTATEYEEARQTAMSQKLKLISVMEQEVVIENLLESKGYEEVAVTIGVTSDTVNVIVKTAELTSQDAAIIYNTLYEQAQIAADNVRIIPVE